MDKIVELEFITITYPLWYQHLNYFSDVKVLDLGLMHDTFSVNLLLFQYYISRSNIKFVDLLASSSRRWPPCWYQWRWSPRSCSGACLFLFTCYLSACIHYSNKYNYIHIIARNSTSFSMWMFLVILPIDAWLDPQNSNLMQSFVTLLQKNSIFINSFAVAKFSWTQWGTLY